MSNPYIVPFGHCRETDIATSGWFRALFGCDADTIVKTQGTFKGLQVMGTVRNIDGGAQNDWMYYGTVLDAVVNEETHKVQVQVHRLRFVGTGELQPRVKECDDGTLNAQVFDRLIADWKQHHPPDWPASATNNTMSEQITRLHEPNDTATSSDGHGKHFDVHWK